MTLFDNTPNAFDGEADAAARLLGRHADYRVLRRLY
jgi:hypothetical protein